MDAIEFLEQPRKITFRIEAKKRQLDAMREALSISAPAINADQVMGGNTDEKISDKIIFVIELEDDIKSLKEDLASAIMNISRELGKLPREDYILLLTERYIRFKQIPDMAADSCVDKRTMQRRLKEAVDSFQSIFHE